MEDSFSTGRVGLGEDDGGQVVMQWGVGRSWGAWSSGGYASDGEHNEVSPPLTSRGLGALL